MYGLSNGCVSSGLVIKKAGLDTSDAQNYRPVSNLTFMSKIVERLVSRQLVDFLERTLLLPSLQSAYRKNHSTLDKQIEIAIA